MVQGALNLAPTLGALSFLGQVDAQNRAQADARRRNRFTTFGTLAGAGLGALLAAPTGGVSIPLGASLGASAGGLLGRSAGGGPAPSAPESLNLGLGIANAQIQGAAADSQARQIGAERGALTGFSNQLEAQQINPAIAGSADDFGIGVNPEAVQGQRIQNIQGALSAGAGSSTPFATARGALSIANTLQPPAAPSFGFQNVPGVGLVRTRADTGQASTAIPTPGTKTPTQFEAFEAGEFKGSGAATDLRQQFPNARLFKVGARPVSKSEQQRDLFNTVGPTGVVTGTGLTEKVARDKADVVAGSQIVRVGATATKPFKSVSPSKLTPKEAFSRANVLRDDFTKASGDFVKMRDSIAKIEIAAANDSPAGDLSLLFNYMRLLDPASVVRESEFATAAQTGSLGERMKGRVERIISGKRLTPTQRADFVSQGRLIFEAQGKAQAQLRNDFTGMAKRGGINPADALPNFANANAKQSDTPASAVPPKSLTKESIGEMNSAQLQAVDFSKLSKEQKELILARMREL